MVRIAVVGDGPAGLSAALFLAKNGHEVTVYAQDETPMHYAHLHNFLGAPDVRGSDFQRIARGQVADHGAALRDAQVEAVSVRDGAFAVRAGGGEQMADYVVLAGGKPSQRLAIDAGAERSEDGVAVDGEYRTSVDRMYAVGRVARPNRSQAIISAGTGAIAALDILSREAGRDVTDWDTVD